MIILLERVESILVVIMALGILCAFLLATAIGLLYQKDKRSRRTGDPSSENPHRYVHDCIEHAFRQQDQELAAKYAEDRRIATWIESQLKDGEINLSSLANGAYQRALALVIKDYEDIVTIAANDLLKITSKISQTRSHLYSHTASYTENLATKDTKALKELEIQEVQAKARLDKAQSALKKLTETTNQLPGQTDEPISQTPTAEITNPTIEYNSDPSYDVEKHW